MKTKYFLVFALFITTAVLVSGCGKADTKLASENAALKAHIQKLEQQLQAANNQMALQAPPSASGLDLTNQLDEAQKKADATADELKSLQSQADAQKAKIDELTRQLAAAQQARDKAEKALLLYQEKTAAAIKEFQTLRGTLGNQTAKSDGYHQSYLATAMAVTKLMEVLPESRVRWQIEAVLDMFTHIDGVWVTADQQMQERTKTAQSEYDKLLSVDGIGTNDYSVNFGKSKILAPAEQENAATAANRDRDIVSTTKDLDRGLKGLQALVSGQRT